MTGLPDKIALVAGATGLVGGHLLELLTRDPAYRQVATLGRRAPELTHEKLLNFVEDFSGEWDEAVVPQADAVFCCLGTTIKQAGSQEAFRAIDLDLVVRIAAAAHAKGASTFVVVSSVGADPTSSNFYLRTKGEMEQAVSELGFERLGILRPSLLLGSRDELRPGERIGQLAARLVDPLMLGGLARYRAVEARTVAGAMIGFDRSDFSGSQVIEGKKLGHLAEHSSPDSR